MARSGGTRDFRSVHFPGRIASIIKSNRCLLFGPGRRSQPSPTPPAGTTRPRSPLQLGVFHAAARDVEQIEVLAVDPPARADAEIADLGGVSALHDALERQSLLRRVMREPARLDEPAAQGCRHLLVLAGDPRNQVSEGLFARYLAHRRCAKSASSTAEQAAQAWLTSTGGFPRLGSPNTPRTVVFLRNLISLILPIAGFCAYANAIKNLSSHRITPSPDERVITAA